MAICTAKYPRICLRRLLLPKFAVATALAFSTNACVQAPTVQPNPDGRGQAGVWSTGIMNGVVMATTRAANHDNVSLRITCGTDRNEKLILTTRVEGLDPVAANRITGLQMPMRLAFDDRSSFDVTSTIISDARQGEALGHQIVSITPPLLRAIKNGRKLEIQNMNERYSFSLVGADSAIQQLQCLP